MSASSAALDRVVARYAGASRFARGFIRGKLRGDPAVSAIMAIGAQRRFGHVVDLGCGRGQLGLLLLEAGLAGRLTGFDLDGAKIATARAAAGLSASFEVANLATAAIPDCDTALLIDVLYQLPAEAQCALLDRIAATTRRLVLIRAFDPARGWRSAFGRAMEASRRILGGDLGRAGGIHPMPLDRIAAPLRAAGFAVTTRPCWGATPLPNVLLVAERAA